MQFESSSIGENSKKQVQEINRLATVCQRKNCIKTNLSVSACNTNFYLNQYSSNSVLINFVGGCERDQNIATN